MVDEWMIINEPIGEILSDEVKIAQNQIYLGQNHFNS